MKNILYLVRAEADFERIVCLTMNGKNNFNQKIVFTGDNSPFFNDGIENIFQKKLFNENGFDIVDFGDYDIVLFFLKKLISPKKITFQNLRNKKKLFLKFLLYHTYVFIYDYKKKSIVNKILSKESINILITDQSNTESNYLQQIFRTLSIERNILVYTITHGAAGGLHSVFSNPIFENYHNCRVFVCNENEKNNKTPERIVLGDVCSSFEYVHFLNKISSCELNFQNEKKYRIAIFRGTAMHTSTSGWHIQEDIIINLSNNPDVAMILKLHPRDANYHDLRMLHKFNNLMIVGKETDRSRLVKWSNIVICSDHCSTIFEPMILKKKVVAIEGNHIPQFKNMHSPLNKSSVNFISNINEFSLENLRNTDEFDEVINHIAWGDNGPVSLPEKLFSYIKSEIK